MTTVSSRSPYSSARIQVRIFVVLAFARTSSPALSYHFCASSPSNVVNVPSPLGISTLITCPPWSTETDSSTILLVSDWSVKVQAFNDKATVTAIISNIFFMIDLFSFYFFAFFNVILLFYNTYLLLRFQDKSLQVNDYFFQ